MRGYRINLLGAFECTYNGKTFDRIPTGKLQLLFVYLLLHMDMPIERKELAFLFWPESADHQAQTNLRKLLYHLKNRLPSVDKYLQLEDGQIIWKSAKGCWVDTAEFTKCADRKQIADLIQAESIYRGHLLPGVQEAVACLHYGLKQAQQSGDRRSTAILTGLLGHAMQLQEHSEEEIALLRRAEQLSKELQFPLFHGNSLYYLGHAYCAREKWAEAQSCLNKALQMMIRDGRSDLLCKVRLLLLQCELATGKITLTNAIEQIQEWLPKYPLRKDQMEMYITLWKWSEKEDVRQEAKRFVTEMYNSMPIPAYRQFMAAMKQAPSIQIMKHPPLPEEVTSYAPL